MQDRIKEAALDYSASLDFTDDNRLNEKGRLKVRSWAEEDFIEGANYVLNEKGWVDVKEGLPGDPPSEKIEIEIGSAIIYNLKHKEYIVAVKNLRDDGLYVTACFFDGDEKRFIGLCSDFHERVKYWMPLPELPLV